MKIHGISARMFLVLALALCFALPPTSSAGTENGNGTTSSECLGLPTDAVQDWKFLYPCCHDEETCEDACESWVRTCNDIARVAYQCQYTSARELTDLFKGGECDVLENKDSKKECSKGAGEDLNELRDFLDSNHRSAKEDCIDCFFDCVDFCEDD